ncbi:MAG TPA: hypothetical protein VFQ91_17910 [Bryobacteraceae bacterium]|nr:hypothetical protein [Bryobacteraceae bacterium]
MTLVWHLLRKDLRHSWIYLAAALCLLLLSATTFFSSLFSLWNARIGGYGSQGIFELLQIAAWSLLCGVLILAEPLPGIQQYWLTRPIRWQQLLSAKVLVIALFAALPIAIAHVAILMFRGFPLTGHLPGIVWNAVLLAAASFLPVALAASISRNLQQLILWLLGLGGLFFVLRQWSPEAAPSSEWIVMDVSLFILILGAGAIITWQYATRHTQAGRVAAFLLIVLAGTVQRWPASVRFGLQRAASPVPVDANVARWRVDLGNTVLQKSTPETAWTGARILYIPIELEGLPEGWTAEWDAWNGIEVSADGDTDGGAAVRKPPTISRRDSQSFVALPISKDFINRHANGRANITLGTELVLYGPAQTMTMDVNGTANLPGLGRCQSHTATELIIGCALAIHSAWNIRGQWAIGEPQEKSPVVLTVPETRSPLALLPSLSPLALPYGGFGATSDYTKGQIYLRLRKPKAYVHRRIEITGLPLY